MLIQPIGQEKIVLKKTFQTKPKTDATDKTVSRENEGKSIFTKDNALPLVSAAVAVASLGIAAYALKSKNNGFGQEAKNNISTEIKTEARNAAERIATELKGKIGEAETRLSETTSKIAKAESLLEETAGKLDEKVRWYDGYLKGIDEKIDNIATRQNYTTKPPEVDLAVRDGNLLLQNLDNSNNRIMQKQGFLNEMRTTAEKFINGKDNNGIPIALAALGVGSTIWLPTAESIPEKEGGLAEVPVQMAMNLDKLNINNYIVRGLIEIPGKTEFSNINGEYYYYHPGFEDIVRNHITGKDEKIKHPMKLEKVLEFDTEVFRKGKTETQHVEVFYGIDPIKGYKRLMFRNKDYFSAPGLYRKTQAVSEKERYTFLNQIMYDFMKIKLDPKSIQGYTIPNQSLYESIKVPDAMVLNDWHTGPLAALMRYKAPFESVNDELSKSASEKLKNMNLLYIVHNSDYQGDDWEHNSEIINTLFGKYALDIYENAKTHFKDNDDNYINSLANVLTVDNTVNMANMGMCLANKVKPVSATYSKEMATRPERSRGLMHVTSSRLAKGTLQGASNGWDRSANEISKDSMAYRQTVNMVNSDIETMKKVLKEFPDFKYNIPKERDIRPVSVDMDINQIMENRKHNKRQFVAYLKSCLDFNWEAGVYNSKLPDNATKIKKFGFDENGISDLSDINLDKLDEIPVLTMGVRFVEQKGVDIIAKALTKLYNDWEENYPGKEKPIIVIGGKDPIEGDKGPYRSIARALKANLGEKGKRLLYMDGFTPNPTFFAGSDFTLRPSHFEPDGDKWESLYRGTPMIMTKVGGHIDSIKDGFNGFLSARTVSEICTQKNIANIKENDVYNEEYLNAMGEDFYGAMKRGINAFYNKDEYQTLVYNSIHGDQSWVQRNAEGKIIECPLVGHMRDLGFDFNSPGLAEHFSDSVRNPKK